jgi:hypothetical protein
LPLREDQVLHRRSTAARVRHGSSGLRYVASLLLRPRMTNGAGVLANRERLKAALQEVTTSAISEVFLRFVINSECAACRHLHRGKRALTGAVLVIPGPRSGTRNPERRHLRNERCIRCDRSEIGRCRTTGRGPAFWIPGSAPRPRNDEGPEMRS